MPRKQHPILFQTEMVQAIDEDRKTMTRRTTGLEGINVNPDAWTLNVCGFVARLAIGNRKLKEGNGAIFRNRELQPKLVFCPYGKVGDLLWVRESFSNNEDGTFDYKADYPFTKPQGGWKPSIHMPKKAARIILEITDIRIERLNDISEDDAIAEGVLEFEDGTFKNYFTQKGFRAEDGVECLLAKGSFQSLIASINGKNIIDLNPWVWVIKFKVLSKNGYPFNGNGGIEAVETTVSAGIVNYDKEPLDSLIKTT
ncbi:MAG: hypothetical protein O9340_04310 [Cyclobacteriaceae bacterium]|nr:hypothetical protein [Cyclobacteriaceae bacterium]